MITKYGQLLLAIVILLICRIWADTTVIDLTGEWQFTSSNKSISGTGKVPGDIYTDLFNSKIIDDPLYGDNHLFMQWVSNDDWTYTKQFDFDMKLLDTSSVLLISEGLDTVATVILNGKSIAQSNNQFVEFFVDITKLIQGHNTLQITFQSPTRYALQTASTYKSSVGHDVPPVCPVPIQNGDCQPNFIRKAQYSFSWDWGPSFPTVGISQPIQIAATDSVYFKDFSWTTHLDGKNWIIDLETLSLHSDENLEVIWTVTIPELGLEMEFPRKVREGGRMSVHEMQVRVREDKVERWWPNGMGKQKMYEIKVAMLRGREMSKRIGFKTVELMQDYVDPNKANVGRNFYFTVNDVPIFIKGSNWIPISMFPLTGNQTERLRFLLDSAAEVGMNALRAWGGGLFESESFYEYASEKGILIWQDLMFACALYPINSDFLDNVKTEVQQQIWRLKKHTSILVYAGNNENEIAIRGHWWSVVNYSEKQQVSDYIVLYADTLAPIVQNEDPSRPFLLSSPSNGIQTMMEGGVSNNPGDTRFGDIHFYNDVIDLWKDSSYLTPRCATEFGVQSVPSNSTLLKWMSSADYSYTSPVFSHRQHSGGKILSNLIMVFSHLPIPPSCSNYTKENLLNCSTIDSPGFLNRFAYLSQINQAITYKVQTEHYRRYRNLTNSKGEGNTMCSLYWQLNDVWAATTWSSIDYELKWKAAHYAARRFLHTLIVVLFVDGYNLGITVVNDAINSVTNAKIVVNQYAWSKGFLPIYNESQVMDIPALSAKSLNFNGFKLSDDITDYLFEAYVVDDKGNQLTPKNYLYPDEFYRVDLTQLGDVSITSVAASPDRLLYNVTLSSTALSPFIWLDLRIPYRGWFSDNAFTMTAPTQTITLVLSQPLQLDKNDFTVCNIKNCGL